MTEQTYLTALGVFIDQGTRSEKQLAELSRDLIRLTADQPQVIDFLNRRAGRLMG